MALTPPQYKQMKQFLESDQRVTLADGGRIGFKRGTFKGQKTIQKRLDGVLTYARRGQPTKTYDPKDYGSEDAAFKAAQKDVEQAKIDKKTARIIKLDIEQIKKLRAQGKSIAEISELLGIDERTLSKNLKQTGLTTRDLTKRRSLPLDIQKDIKAKFSSVKNWDFDKYLFGVPPGQRIKTVGGKQIKPSNIEYEKTRLYDRITDFVDSTRTYELAGDFSKPEGWMAQQMNRSYKLGNKDYIPIKGKINNKNKIIGFIDNTEFGGGGKYMLQERFIKGKNADGILMSLHPDYTETAKLVDISRKAKLPIQGTLKKLLQKEGFDTTRITLSDLFKYMKGQVGIEGTKNALERHHISGVKSRATGNYQLLDRDLNILAKEIESEIVSGDLSRVGELKKKGVMVEVGGKVYGSGPKTPEGQFRRFEKQIEKDLMKTDLKKIKGLIATLSKDPRCQIRGLKNQGGRVGFQDGSVNLDICFRGGVDNINRGLPNPTAAQARNFGRVAAFGRNVVKFGVLPEALFIAGESVIRMGMGDSLPESILRASEYLLPGNQTKLADRMMLARTVGPKTAELILKANELRGFENQIQSLENEKQFTGILTDDGFDDNFFGQTKVEEENVIQKQIDALKKRKESYGSLTQAQYQFADVQAQEAEDIKTSRALFPKLLAKARSVDIASDDPLAEAAKRTMDLDLKMLPSRFQRQIDLDVRKPVFDKLVNTPDQQLSNIFKGQELENILRDKKYIQGYRAETVEDAAAQNPEAMFSASTGLFFGEPLDKGVSYTPPPIDTITEMEKEIVGQTNVANPFDIDRSSVATGLRGFAAAGGGIAKLAGKPSGPPPTSGPTSQGLPGLLKRDRII